MVEFHAFHAFHVHGPDGHHVDTFDTAHEAGSLAAELGLGSTVRHGSDPYLPLYVEGGQELTVDVRAFLIWSAYEERSVAASPLVQATD